MLAAIIAAIRAIPDLVSVARDVVKGIEAMVAQLKRIEEEKWIGAHRETIFKLVHAKTDSERFLVLRELIKLRDDMPDS